MVISYCVYRRFNDNTAISGSSDNEDKLPSKFFVYGALRDDDDSGASATNGKLYGYKMYQRKGTNYSFAVSTGNIKHFIVGMIQKVY